MIVDGVFFTCFRKLVLKIRPSRVNDASMSKLYLLFVHKGNIENFIFSMFICVCVYVLLFISELYAQI